MFPDLLDITKNDKISQSKDNSFLTESSKINYKQNTLLNQSLSCKNLNNSNEIQNNQYTTNSPAQIRTGVKGSKGLYACPLHSALVILPGFRAFLYCKYGRY